MKQLACPLCNAMGNITSLKQTNKKTYEGFFSTKAESLIQKAFKPGSKAGVQIGKVATFACPTVILFPRHHIGLNRLQIQFDSTS